MRQDNDEERVSLADLDPEEALRALLKVDPKELPPDEPLPPEPEPKGRDGSDAV